ncbi:hypothetical protein PR048_027925 [Dryococelus australis]|uniref:Uncharacterized protein n=1 Tax=Dryococelus australis TaxID=614101 RepID=A0ABQ9GHW3_9NEOP|nr:hypothetical protein PR048_027925 [Dryococelus australis]
MDLFFCYSVDMRPMKKNVSVIDMAREKGSVIVYFLPHCTYKLQPLNVSFMEPLSAFHRQEVKTWLLNNSGQVVTQFQIAGFFGYIYVKAAMIQNAISGFMKTGIYPLNEHNDFAPSETTERIPAASQTQMCINNDETITISIHNLDHLRTLKTVIGLHQSLPNSLASKSKGKAVVITDSPYKNELVEGSVTSNAGKQKVKRKMNSSIDELRSAQKKKVVAVFLILLAMIMNEMHFVFV